MSKHREQIIEAARGKVDEELLGAVFANPRGASTAVIGGGIAGEIGGAWSRKQGKGASGASIELGNPGALAVTATSLLTMKTQTSFGGGQVKDIEQVLSVVPLAEIDSVQVKRFGLTGVMEITAGGNSFKLEGKVPDMREFAEAFDRAKAAV